MQIWPRRPIGFVLFLAALLGAGASAFVVRTQAPASAWIWPPVLTAAVLLFGLRRFVRRWRAGRHPFPAAWREELERRVAFYRVLDSRGRARFEQDVRIFVAEQSIYGPKGTPVDDATKVLIASSAAMLGHGRPGFEWPRVRDIVVYPTRFDDDYNISSDHAISGMVHAQGPVLFSRADVRHGFRKSTDGSNVALHELAHVLDFATGAADGVPGGFGFVSSAPWIQAVTERLKKVRKHRYRHVLRDYAGVNEAEFFAVAVEAFFERPARLHRNDAELYDMLREYFAVDTLSLLAKKTPTKARAGE